MPEDATEEIENRLTFDALITDQLKLAIQNAMLDHPEIRSIAAVVDYKGGLATAEINKIVWMGENGNVSTPDAVIGSIQVMLEGLAHMFKRGQLLEQGLREKLTAVSLELAVKLKEQEDARNTHPAPAAAGPRGLTPAEEQAFDQFMSGCGYGPASRRKLLDRLGEILKSNRRGLSESELVRIKNCLDARIGDYVSDDTRIRLANGIRDVLSSA